MNDKAKVFFTKISEKVKNGDYDEFLDIPFISRKTILAAFKARILKKIETNATPLLSDKEIYECIGDAREVAAITAKLFLELGILEKTDDGLNVSDNSPIKI